MALSGTNPIDLPDLYDVLFISGIQAPGIARIEGASRQYKWDVKTGKGLSGGTTTFQGADVPKFKVVLKIWTQQHFDDWGILREVLIDSVSQKSITALIVTHRYLQELNIFSCVVESIGMPKAVKESDSLYTVEFDLIEYHPVKKSGGTPTASKTQWVGGAFTAQDKQLNDTAALLQQAQNAYK